MSLLADPRIFSYIIMVLYALNSIRWAFSGSWVDVSYWVCALGITATVTFGYRHCT